MTPIGVSPSPVFFGCAGNKGVAAGIPVSADSKWVVGSDFRLISAETRHLVVSADSEGVSQPRAVSVDSKGFRRRTGKAGKQLAAS